MALVKQTRAATEFEATWWNDLSREGLLGTVCFMTQSRPMSTKLQISAMFSKIADLNVRALQKGSFAFLSTGIHILGRDCRRVLVFLACVAAMSGCATNNREGLRPVPPDEASEMVLTKPIYFAAVGAGSSSTYWYHGLAPGRYKVEATDDTGDYYAGDGQLLIFGASREADGQVEEPRALGGFWLSRNRNAQPAFKLYRINPKNIDGSGLSEDMRLGPVVYAVLAASGATNRMGLGDWSWQFVPMVYRGDDVDRLIEVTSRP
jgi:hypothetical protein